MVKHMERIWVHADDKKLAKANASLRGMKIADYFGERIREDAKVSREKMTTMSEKFSEKRRKEFDWF